MTDAPLTLSTLTCPACGTRTEAEMPTDACQFFWACPTCGAVVRPKPGDCCVFCSYGTVVCPPVQRATSKRTQTDGNDTPGSCCS